MTTPRRIGVVFTVIAVAFGAYVLYERHYVRQQIAAIPRIATPKDLFDASHASSSADSIAAAKLPASAFDDTVAEVDTSLPGPVTTTLAASSSEAQAPSASPVRAPGTTTPDTAARKAALAAAKKAASADDLPDVTVPGLPTVVAPQLDHRSVVAFGGPDAQNYLIIGTDSRANVNAQQSQTFGKELVGGARSDTIFVLRVDRKAHAAWALSIPRDTWVHIAGTNSYNRINAAFGHGAPVLVRTIQENFDLPINHFAIVDFEGFQRIVEAVGGAKVCFPAPLRDKVTGLDQPFGCHVLDPVQAIAFVRSRHAEQQKSDGTWVSDPRGDLGRIQRQQAFLRGVISQGLSQGIFDPTGLSKFLPRLKSALAIDDTFNFEEVQSLSGDFRSFDPNSLITDVIPTSPRRVGGKDVLVLNVATAAQHVGKFGHR